MQYKLKAGETMAKNRILRVEDEIWEEFQRIAKEEGRFLGKVLEMMIDAFKKNNNRRRRMIEEK